jgi:hypothetical protein
MSLLDGVQQSRDTEMLLPSSCMDTLGCIEEERNCTTAGLAFPKPKPDLPSLVAVSPELRAWLSSAHTQTPSVNKYEYVPAGANHPTGANPIPNGSLARHLLRCLVDAG